MNRTKLPYIILCCGIIALLGMMASCHPDKIGESEDSYLDSDEEMTVNVILHCSGDMKNASGTLMLSADEENGYGNEIIINKARVYFYDSKTKHLFMQKDLEGLKYDPAYSDSKYDISYLSSEFKMKCGSYDIFVIANLDDKYLPDMIRDEIEFLNSIDSVTYKSGLLTSLSSAGLVMTNRGEDYLNTLLKSTETNRTISIDLERAVAKISFGQAKPNFDLYHNGRKYANVNITNFKLVNLPTKYYLFRHVGEVSDFNNPPEFTIQDNFGDLTGKYIIDPLFFFKDETVSHDPLVYDNYYEDWYGNRMSGDHAPMPAPPGKAVFYILENGIYNGYQKKAYVTGILMTGAVTTDSVYCYDPITMTVYQDENPEHWTERLYLYDFRFYDSIKALNTKYGRTILDESKEGLYTDKELKMYNVKQITRSMGIYGTKYSYWIKHLNDGDDTKSSTMEHAIVRNNYYKLILTNITGLGPSVVPDDELYVDVEPNCYIDVAP